MNKDKTHLLFFDKEHLLKQQDREFAAIMLDTFWNDEPYDDLVKLQKFIDTHDIEQVLLLLHKVKPNLSIIGMHNFYQHLEHIYSDLKEGKSVEQRMADLKDSLNFFFQSEKELQKNMII